MTSQANIDLELAREIKAFYADPLEFVRFAYPWGEPGTELEHETGPDDNQRQFLTDIGKAVASRRFNGRDPVMPILFSETSGHGTGKSVQGAWIADWILSTRPDSIGTVTAGTFAQLESRTWSTIQHWTKLCITGHWFNIQARGIYHKLRPKTWKIVAQTCKEENAQAFAGQHARTSTSWYMFDEASLIPDKVWTVAQGGLTDGEPMFFAWGQCERGCGRFFEINFGSREHRWDHRTIDSRQSRFVDSAYGAPYVERLHVLGYDNVIEVNFGGSSPDRHQANMRAYMWNRLKEWLPHGAIPADDEKLASDLAGPGAHIRNNGQLVIEAKQDMQKRGLASPDDGDALALTFAHEVAPKTPEPPPDDEEEFINARYHGGGGGAWMR